MVALDKNDSDIIWKDGVGTYSYDSSRPHAMTATSGDGKVYKYDANGNIKQRGGNSIWWTAFNKTRSIFADNGAGYTFYYDANHSRVLETVVAGDLKSWNKFFVGGLYEEQHKDGKIEKRHFIPTPAGVIGVWSTSTDPHTPASRDYRVNDHLGSASVIVGEGGDIRDEYSYDSWGNPRSVTNWSVGLSNWPSYLANRGFTGHEMLEEIELIHMNARIYDPVLGKFLSPDTYIQFEHNLQSYNRYSYVINNPLRYTDPSGNFVFTLAAIAYTASIEGIKWYVAAAIFATAGVADALLQGATVGQALKAGAIAGVSAAITVGIGGYFDARAALIEDAAYVMDLFGYAGEAFRKSALMRNAIARATAHGVVQGGIASAQGGNFGASALAGIASSAGGSLQGASGIGDYPIVSTLAAAAVGGAVSEIGGGKFSNGAISGAMVHVLNHLNSGSQEEEGIIRGKKVPWNEDNKYYSDPSVSSAGPLPKKPTLPKPLNWIVKLFTKHPVIQNLNVAANPSRIGKFHPEGTKPIYTIDLTSAETHLRVDFIIGYEYSTQHGGMHEIPDRVIRFEALASENGISYMNWNRIPYINLQNVNNPNVIYNGSWAGLFE